MVEKVFDNNLSSSEFYLGDIRLTFPNKVNVESSFFDFYQMNDNEIDSPKIISTEDQILILDESENYILAIASLHEAKLTFQTYINTRLEIIDNHIEVIFEEGYRTQSFLMHDYSNIISEYDYGEYTLEFSEDFELGSYEVLKNSALVANTGETTVIRDINDRRGDYLFALKRVDEGINLYNNIPYTLEISNNKLNFMPVVNFFNIEEDIKTKLGSYNIQHIGHGRLYQLNDEAVYVWGADHFPNLSSRIKYNNDKDLIHIHNLGDTIQIKEDSIVISDSEDILNHEHIDFENLEEQEISMNEDFSKLELKLFSVYFPNKYILYKESVSNIFCITNKENNKFFIHFRENEDGSLTYDAELFTNTYVNYKDKEIYFT